MYLCIKLKYTIMSGYKDMIEMIGKFKHVPEVLANPDNAYNRYATGGTLNQSKNTTYTPIDPYTPIDQSGIGTSVSPTTPTSAKPMDMPYGTGGGQLAPQWFTSVDGGDGGIGTPRRFQPYYKAMGDDGNLLTGASASGIISDDITGGGGAGGGYQGLTPYGAGRINHPLIVPRVTSFKKGGKMYLDGGKKKAVTEEDFKYTSFDKLTPEQQKSLLTHFSNTEGYHPYGHLVTDGSGITFGSGIDVKAVTTEKSLIKHGISKEDAKSIIKGLQYKKSDGKGGFTNYDMTGKSIKTIKADLGWDDDKLEEYVKKIKFSNTTQTEIVSKSVDKNYNNNSDLFNKVSNFEDFTVLSSVVHFTGDSHYDDESRTIDRNKNASTKRALQITIADLMNKYDGKLSSEEFHNVIYQADKIVDDQGGIGVKTDVSHPGKESATFNRWNKELNYSLGTLGDDYEHDETKYYTINVDDLGEQGSSDKKTLMYYDATYVEPKVLPTEETEVLPTEGMNVTPTQDMNQKLTPSESNLYGYEDGGTYSIYDENQLITKEEVDEIAYDNQVKEKTGEIFNMINPYNK